MSADESLTSTGLGLNPWPLVIISYLQLQSWSDAQMDCYSHLDLHFLRRCARNFSAARHFVGSEPWSRKCGVEIQLLLQSPGGPLSRIPGYSSRSVRYQTDNSHAEPVSTLDLSVCSRRRYFNLLPCQLITVTSCHILAETGLSTIYIAYAAAAAALAR